MAGLKLSTDISAYESRYHGSGAIESGSNHTPGDHANSGDTLRRAESFSSLSQDSYADLTELLDTDVEQAISPKAQKTVVPDPFSLSTKEADHLSDGDSTAKLGSHVPYDLPKPPFDTRAMNDARTYWSLHEQQRQATAPFYACGASTTNMIRPKSPSTSSDTRIPLMLASMAAGYSAIDINIYTNQLAASMSAHDAAEYLRLVRPYHSMNSQVRMNNELLPKNILMAE